jgi:GTP-binding protein
LLLDDELEERVQQASDHCGHPVLAISAATSSNLDKLLTATWKELGI